MAASAVTISAFPLAAGVSETLFSHPNPVLHPLAFFAHTVILDISIHHRWGSFSVAVPPEASDTSPKRIVYSKFIPEREFSWHQAQQAAAAGGPDSRWAGRKEVGEETSERVGYSGRQEVI